MKTRYSSRTITYNSKNRLSVGFGLPVRINTSIGLNRKSNLLLENEKIKIDNILMRLNKPDLMMDLSICKHNIELWQYILEQFEGPVGVIPHYLIFDERNGLDKVHLLERIHLIAESGISFITVHATPTIRLNELAYSTRKLPVTSRGGGIVIRDMLINKRCCSIYADIYDDICKIALKHNIVINLGTTYRSASTVDGLDAACCAEIINQKYFIDKALGIGVQVVLEGPGHILMSSINQYIKFTKGYNIPLMPLGPIVTDIFPGLDHYSSTIGAAYMMSKTKGGIINSVTRVEHEGGIPTIKHLNEALDAATVAAHSASSTYHRQSYKKEIAVANARGVRQSCSTFQNNRKGCSRCRDLCPLIQTKYV